MSRISVVVPSYNDARMLEVCLTALATQTRAPDEIIVVDNGSTDDTVEVARAAGARVVSEPRRGVLRATACGFDAAVGDIIGRLDADSRPGPEWTARLEELFSADPTLDAVTGTGAFYGRGPVWHFVGRYLYLGGYFLFMGAAMGHRPVFGSSFALRRPAWRDVRTRIHLDDPRMHDDLDISFALGPEMGVAYDPALTVLVSARPFDTFSGFVRRASWGFHVVAVNWSDIGWLRRLWLSAQGQRRRRARRRVIARSASASLP
ncbi:glycosyltransferase family 2 protein [Microbacterium caowuchunii]|nr:glycosyltransferase family 2 protein [Microbacterium caowuchunii]